MAVQTYLLGRKAVAYYNEGELLFGDASLGPGTDPIDVKILKWLASAGANLLTLPALNMVDVSLNISSEFADGTTRETASTGFASQIPVLRGGEVTFEARWKPDDPSQTGGYPFSQVLTRAWEQDKPLAMVFLDQDNDPEVSASGGSDKIIQGLAANFVVSFSKAEALRDVQRMSVSLSIADSGAWYSALINAV